MDLGALLVNPMVGPIIKPLFGIPIEKIKKRARDALQEKIAIERVKGELRTGPSGHSFPPLAFTLLLYSRGFDDVHIKCIDCIFLYKNIPLQLMRWEKGDEWASNLTRPHTSEGKLKALGELSITIFFNPIIDFSLWTLAKEIRHREEEFSVIADRIIELPNSKNEWSIEGAITFESKYGNIPLKIDLFSCCRGIEAEDWGTICERSVKPTLERLGIRWIDEV
ncbi:hypothetical protein M1O54_00280 [Dehalococcoidia bacterium]|nr:hypothetical protein [Dehalococcoidia bacterium]MCL0088797.1 hypothetical protein [Dehalococcoidia bacterium]MCL0092340.1 hypothetical protein [Dehalococcoidia bacterium]